MTGLDWLLTPERVAVHLPTATAVAADLHLGYDLARQRTGEAVPRTRLEDVLAPLAVVVARHNVRRLVVAGDLFEDAYRVEVADGLLDWLHRRGVQLAALVPGNHDRGLERAPHLPLWPDGFLLGTWRVLHGDAPLPPGPVVLGHWHPCLRWHGRLSAPCYLHSPDRLVLPAYSADAAGVNVLTQARWRGYRCQVIVGDQVLDFGEVESIQRKKGWSPGGMGRRDTRWP